MGPSAQAPGQGPTAWLRGESDRCPVPPQHLRVQGLRVGEEAPELTPEPCPPTLSLWVCLPLCLQPPVTPFCVLLAPRVPMSVSRASSGPAHSGPRVPSTIGSRLPVCRAPRDSSQRPGPWHRPVPGPASSTWAQTQLSLGARLIVPRAAIRVPGVEGRLLVSASAKPPSSWPVLAPSVGGSVSSYLAGAWNAARMCREGRPALGVGGAGAGARAVTMAMAITAGKARKRFITLVFKEGLSAPPTPQGQAGLESQCWGGGGVIPGASCVCVSVCPVHPAPHPHPVTLLLSLMPTSLSGSWSQEMREARTTSCSWPGLVASGAGQGDTKGRVGVVGRPGSYPKAGVDQMTFLGLLAWVRGLRVQVQGSGGGSQRGGVPGCLKGEDLAPPTQSRAPLCSRSATRPGPGATMPKCPKCNKEVYFALSRNRRGNRRPGRETRRTQIPGAAFLPSSGGAGGSGKSPRLAPQAPPPSLVQRRRAQPGSPPASRPEAPSPPPAAPPKPSGARSGPAPTPASRAGLEVPLSPRGAQVPLRPWVGRRACVGEALSRGGWRRCCATSMKASPIATTPATRPCSAPKASGAVGQRATLSSKPREQLQTGPPSEPSPFPPLATHTPALADGHRPRARLI
ncbi:hypothetical protein J1605_011791 [Eschrichtius robustus]|uniref:Basic proline-rich protein-like n=1 Tax=Eschrichtius robustus TaxID=9764 RepID=A0AB34GM78_ESCRO|nr:hypothetical protein J1605_011791 [Eschrichtius robustus]